MKIALFNTFTPFVRGGAEILVDDLYEQLIKANHEVDLFRIPFPNNFELPLLMTILSSKMFRFDQYDRLIVFKFPAYSASHPNKVIWIFHQFRQAYELFGHEYGLANDSTGLALQQIFANSDNLEITEARKVYTNAFEVTNRLMVYNKIQSEVLNPPLKESDTYHNNSPSDYIYYPSRITSIKRQHLAIEAMKYVKSDVKLLITGKCDEPGYIDELEKLISRNKLDKKVKLVNEWISDKAKIDNFANSLGVLYIPYKEDSCGFVSMEAFYSSKPVISCFDSGGTTELIDDGVTGLFCEPTAEDLAKKMDLLFFDKEACISMGKNARREIIKRDYTWENTIRRLLL